MNGPSEASILERARSLCNEACYTVALQHRRLRSREPEDGEFIFRWWADLQFLIVALRRPRRAAMLAARVPAVSSHVRAAVAEFDKTLPGLDRMRNVGEHIDECAMASPKRHDRHVRRLDLQVGTWDGTVFGWLKGSLNIDTARDAASRLFDGLRDAIDDWAASHSNP